MNSPKVSVIIPNYNHADHLNQRIETVLNQTYKDFELIILDDCSTDNSKTIIESYRSHPAVSKIHFNESNSGSPFKQWEKGVSFAKGEWVWIAESDDYADEKFLEILISSVGNQSNIGLMYCDSNIVIDNVVIEATFATHKNKRFNTVRWSKNYFNKGLEEIENYLLPGGTINNTSAVLFNRAVFLKVNPFDLALRYIGDKYSFIKVLAFTDVVYVSQRLNYFRDPFNTKHADKFIYYFYEQFLVFDWVHKNLKIEDKKKFMDGFYGNTRNSLFRDWGSVKVFLYKELFVLNPKLFLRSILNNLYQSIRSAGRHHSH